MIKAKLDQLDKRLLTILLIVFVQMVGAAMSLPILLLFAQRTFQIRPEINALLISSFFAAQFLAGPTIGRLSDKYGRIPVLLVSQIGTVISFIMIGAAPNVTTLFVARVLDGITGLKPREVLHNGRLLAILLIAFIGQFALGLLQATFSLYGDAVLFARYSEQIVDLGIGLLLATVGLSQFFTQTTLIRRVLPRFGEANLVIIGGLLRALGMFFFAIAFSPWLGVPGSLFFAMGMGLMMPPLQSLSTRTVSDEVRGGVLGLYQSTVSLSTIFSTALGGIFFAVNPRFPYWTGLLLSLFALVPAYIYLIRPLHPKKPETILPK